MGVRAAATPGVGLTTVGYDHFLGEAVVNAWWLMKFFTLGKEMTNGTWMEHG